MFTNPPTEAIARILREAKTVAVIGLSPKPGRDSHHVAADLQGFGYRIVPVRPMAAEILGEKAWPTLSALPPELLAQVDIVDVFRAPEHVDEIVDECLRLSLTGKTLWLQLGVVNESAAARATAGGLQVIMDRCIYVDYLRLVGHH